MRCDQRIGFSLILQEFFRDGIGARRGELWSSRDGLRAWILLSWWFCSGSAALEFPGLEDDEVLVKRLQGGVGEAGGAVEDGSADEHHVETLDDGAAGEAVEDGLLVEAADVEGGDLGVLEPGVEEEVAAAKAEATDSGWGGEG